MIGQPGLYRCVCLSRTVITCWGNLGGGRVGSCNDIKYIRIYVPVSRYVEGIPRRRGNTQHMKYRVEDQSIFLALLQFTRNAFISNASAGSGQG